MVSGYAEFKVEDIKSKIDDWVRALDPFQARFDRAPCSLYTPMKET